jgi:hypothetical protein
VGDPAARSEDGVAGDGDGVVRRRESERERGSGWFGLGWGCHRGAAGVIMAVLVLQPASQLWFRSGRSVGGAHRWRPSSLISSHTGRMYRHTISATWRTLGSTNTEYLLPGVTNGYYSSASLLRSSIFLSSPVVFDRQDKDIWFAYIFFFPG